MTEHCSVNPVLVEAEVDNNLLSAFLTSRAAFPHLQAAGDGVIINFARAGQPQANMVAYNCAKEGIEASPARSRSREGTSVSAPGLRGCARARCRDRGAGGRGAGVARLVHISGIGADPVSGSPYIRARGRGELVVQKAFPGVTIVRPGAMFGPGDALFSTLADFARLLPILPLIGGGNARLQPVFVEDVAEAIASILADSGTVGRTYELAGPGVYTLRELVCMMLRLTGRRRLLIPVPFAVAEIQARLFELLPNSPLTTGQVDLLKVDNVASGILPGLHELKIHPKTVEEVVPTYIGTRAPEPH